MMRLFLSLQRVTKQLYTHGLTGKFAEGNEAMANKTTFAHEFVEFAIKDSKLYLYDNLDKQHHIIPLIAPEIKVGIKHKVPAYLAQHIKQ